MAAARSGIWMKGNRRSAFSSASASPVKSGRSAFVARHQPHRLLDVAPDRWILKGVLALDFRIGVQARATMDMDLGRYDDADAATTDLLAAQTRDLGDYFVFSVQPLLVQTTPDRFDHSRRKVAALLWRSLRQKGRGGWLYTPKRGRIGMKMALQIELPDELTTLLGPNPSAAVRDAVLLQLVHEGRMSVAYAGQLLGLDRLDAVRWYTSHGYHYPDLTPAELQEDLNDLDDSLGHG